MTISKTILGGQKGTGDEKKKIKKMLKGKREEEQVRCTGADSDALNALVLIRTAEIADGMKKLSSRLERLEHDMKQEKEKKGTGCC